MSDPGAQPPYVPPSVPPPIHQGGLPSMPPGHMPCPRCGQPVLPTAPLCPNCGERLVQGRSASRKITGVWWLLAGVGVMVLSGLVFFFGCIAALSNSSGSGSGGKAFEWLLPVAGFGLLTGVVMMLVGFVVALVQVLRK